METDMQSWLQEVAAADEVAKSGEIQNQFSSSLDLLHSSLSTLS